MAPLSLFSEEKSLERFQIRIEYTQNERVTGLIATVESVESLDGAKLNFWKV